MDEEAWARAREVRESEWGSWVLEPLIEAYECPDRVDEVVEEGIGPFRSGEQVTRADDQARLCRKRLELVGGWDSSAQPGPNRPLSSTDLPSFN